MHVLQQSKIKMYFEIGTASDEYLESLRIAEQNELTVMRERANNFQNQKSRKNKLLYQSSEYI